MRATALAPLMTFTAASLISAVHRLLTLTSSNSLLNSSPPLCQYIAV